MDWQPIETVPKGMSDFCLVFGGGDQWVAWNDGGGWIYAGEGFDKPVYTEEAITHWMPLPEPPK